MQREVHLKMIEGGWILVELRFSSTTEFSHCLERMKRTLHVFIYDQYTRKYKTSVYELKRLSDMCDVNNIELYITDKVARNYSRLQYKHAKTKKMLKAKESAFKIPLWTDDPGLQPRNYQYTAIAMMVFRKRFLLGDDMGLGKTPQAIGVMLMSWKKFGFSDGLYVVTNRLVFQWKSEILKFTKLRPNQIEILGERVCRTRTRSHFLSVGKECKACKFYDACKFDSETSKKSAAAYRTLQIRRAKVLICGYSAMRLHTKDFIRRKFEVNIFDEATKMKNHQSGVGKGAKAIVKSLPLYHVVIPMSGTFIENRLEELYAVMDLVDPRVLGGFSNFRHRHLTTDSFNNVIGYRNEDQLKFKLDNMLIRRTIDEVWHDRPEMTETIVECRMGTEQEKFYAKARDGILDELKDLEQQGKINQANVATLLTYLLMVCSTVKAVDPENPMKEHSSKCDMLKEILQEQFPASGKMVLFSRFSNKVTPHLMKEMKTWKIGPILRITDRKSQERTVEEFRTNPLCKVMVCSDAVAYGANFQFANYLVNFDLPWNPAILDQRIRRVYRQGQKQNVNVYNFLVPNTAEEHLYQVLQRKRELFARYLKESMIGDKQEKMNLSLKEMIRLI